MTWKEVRRAKRRFERKLLRKANVVGLAIGKKVVGGVETEEPCVVVLVRKKLPEAELRPGDIVPRRVDDVKTDVVETGEIRALGMSVVKPEQESTARWRPAPGGVSIGHYRVTAGTLGCVVHRGSEAYILSNNHILADTNRGRKGDAVLQPAAMDGGEIPKDTIAVLEEFIPIRWMPRTFLCRILPFYQSRNRVDCAIARPLNDDDLENEVRLIGKVAGLAEVSVGLSVLKSGRTTGLTRGKVTHQEATVTVSYGGGRSALFEDQVLTSSMSEGGDSGSLVMDEQKRAVGLLFAGSDKVTVLNGIADVLSSLKVTL